MATVYRKENETTEQLIKRFKKAVVNDRILEEYKKREYYIAPSLKKKIKHAAALKKQKKYQKKKYVDRSLDY